jgi:hypothetical protein
MLFSFVAISRPGMPDHLGMFWYGQSRSTTTVYVPFYAAQKSVPDSYLEGVESKFNFDSAWWPFSFVSNIAQLKWSLMFPDVKAEQEQLESGFRAAAAEVEAKALEVLESSGVAESVKLLEEFSNSQAAKAIQAWWDLAWRLIQTYSNGFITKGEAAERPRPGYPEWWLEATGEYESWPGNTFTDPRRPGMCGGDVDSASETFLSSSGTSKTFAMVDAVAERSYSSHETPASSSTTSNVAAFAPYLLFGAATMIAGAIAGYALGRRGFATVCDATSAINTDGVMEPLL